MSMSMFYQNNAKNSLSKLSHTLHSEMYLTGLSILTHNAIKSFLYIHFRISEENVGLFLSLIMKRTKAVVDHEVNIKTNYTHKTTVPMHFIIIIFYIRVWRLRKNCIVQSKC